MRPKDIEELFSWARGMRNDMRLNPVQFKKYQTIMRLCVEYAHRRILIGTAEDVIPNDPWRALHTKLEMEG